MQEQNITYHGPTMFRIGKHAVSIFQGFFFWSLVISIYMFAHDCQHMDCLVARRVYQIKKKISFCDTLTLIKTGVPLQIVIFGKMSLIC